MWFINQSEDYVRIGLKMRGKFSPEVREGRIGRLRAADYITKPVAEIVGI